MKTIVQPSGRLIHSGFFVGCLLVICALVWRKCPAIPESKIPWSVGVWSSLFIILLHSYFVQLNLNTLCHYHHYHHPL